MLLTFSSLFAPPSWMLLYCSQKFLHDITYTTVNLVLQCFNRLTYLRVVLLSMEKVVLRQQAGDYLLFWKKKKWYKPIWNYIHVLTNVQTFCQMFHSFYYDNVSPGLLLLTESRHKTDDIASLFTASYSSRPFWSPPHFPFVVYDTMQGVQRRMVSVVISLRKHVRAIYCNISRL